LHYIIKHYKKQYDDDSGRKSDSDDDDDDITIIPLNGERFLRVTIGNVKFLDSFHFLPTSLDNLVTLLLKSGKENFHNTTRYLGDNDLIFKKGQYPYS